MYVAGQRTQVVHDIIDTEIVTVNGLVQVHKIIGELVFREISDWCLACFQRQVCINHRILLIERHLTDTVDGVVGVVHNLWHTVLSTLHHHTTAEHTAEVGSLDGIHQTTRIDRQHTIFLPITSSRIGINRTVTIEHVRICCRTFEKREDIISR